MGEFQGGIGADTLNLQTFETEGGKIAALLFLEVFLAGIAFALHMTHHDPQEAGRSVLITAFTGVSTLLLAKLGAKP